MLDKGLLEDGLNIIAQCKKQTGDIWHAHYGSAAIAGYFFVKENDLPAETAIKAIAQAKEMVKKHSVPHHKNGTHFIDSNHADAVILEALDRTIDQLHWVGHNVIYAALCLLAMQELRYLGTEEDLTGIAALLNSFGKTIPGRSWLGYSASEVKRLDILEADNFPHIERADQLSEFILQELAGIKTIYKAESHHDLIGHMLTFSHALNILYDLGHIEYFKRGIRPLLKVVKVLRASREITPDTIIPLSSPVDSKPLIQSTRNPHLPVEPEYWSADPKESDWDFGHQFKFPFSFYNHINRVKEINPLSIENFRCLIVG